MKSKETVRKTQQALQMPATSNMDIMEQILTELENKYPTKKPKENVPTGTEFP